MKNESTRQGDYRQQLLDRAHFRQLPFRHTRHATGLPERLLLRSGIKMLKVGEGEIRPVESEVYNYNVSGLEVIKSWLGCSKKNPTGRKSSPLDEIRPERWTGDMTRELLELLWVLKPP